MIIIIFFTLIFGIVLIVGAVLKGPLWLIAIGIICLIIVWFRLSTKI
ncbi:MAG: hypothetical protein K940chlam5_00919 [Candidatus Anoxychlamydiales bacterium]|nr:hypothetical protein [Candidatus Anoxychlamydiales bacterium]